MCGIAGAVGATPDERRPRLTRALDAMRHRGPDGLHTYRHDLIDLAHARLSIIDPSTASDQPMVDEESGCVLVFNGELYNYRELRPELEARHHRFRSAGDTEVLLRSYLEWGDRCVERFNGMFAFAIWDPTRSLVLLARDRLGEKPLHLCRSGGMVWFASEIKSLLAAGVAPHAPDHDYLFGFLAHGDLGHPLRTPVAGVDQLPAGHAAHLTAGGDLRPWSYWSLPLSPTEERPADENGEMAELFGDSVRLRLRSDVPLGTSLSGGLDSSLVLATVRTHRPDGELHAFTASFPGTEMDELPLARRVADQLGVTLHPVPLSGHDLGDGLDGMAWANEGPVESPSTFAQYRVMRAAKDEGITVLLDGQGADETWSGYEKYAQARLVDHIVHGRLDRALALRRAWNSIHDSQLRPHPSNYLGLTAPPAVRRRMASLAQRRGPTWLAPDYRRRHRSADPIAGIGATRGRIGHLGEDQGRLDLERITLPRLLRYADRNSMAWSREVRLPFLDHRLVELADTVSFERKVVGGWTKEPLRRLLEDGGLPATARRRDKLAYMPPTATWLNSPGLNGRVAEAWAALHAAGLLATERPATEVAARWRVLSVHAWAAAFAIPLG